MQVQLKTHFSATGFHQFWVTIFTIIILILGLFFLAILALYFRLQWVLSEIMQNKKLGQKIQSKMQESEYNSFLIMEKDKFDFLNNKPIGTNSTADD